MYYPFLRGKQEELLALQELLEADRLSKKIIPVIEPIKLSSTLINTLQTFWEKKRKVYLVVNPIIGQFEDDLSVELVGDETESEKKQIERLIFNRERYNELITYDVIDFAIYYQNDFLSYYRYIQESMKNKEDIIALFTKDENLEGFIESEDDLNSAVSILFVSSIEDIDGIDNSSVIFRDRFNKANKNAEYPDDEFFSKDHLIYSKYGCSGFSDYSIVGQKYEDGGFTPRAIAIHIVYPTDKRILNIRHFLSDSNLSAKNPAGKFAEAGKKLFVWSTENPNIESLGLSKLIDCYQSEHYPGLGNIKRYSIMHHLEIEGQILEELK